MRNSSYIYNLPGLTNAQSTHRPGKNKNSTFLETCQISQGKKGNANLIVIKTLVSFEGLQ